MSTEKSRLPITGESHALIFDSALSGALSQKVTTVGLSAFFWGIWLALWAPLLTYLLWLVAPIWGATRVLESSDQSFPVLVLLTATGLALGAILVMGGALQWAFGAVRARPAMTTNVTARQLADFHGLAEADLVASWTSRRLVIHHNDDSSISKVELTD
jgi:poly-beta-1,6-N-acetyl-D-glucosamine biosynthesis protein PgaD